MGNINGVARSRTAGHFVFAAPIVRYPIFHYPIIAIVARPTEESTAVKAPACTKRDKRHGAICNRRAAWRPSLICICGHAEPGLRLGDSILFLNLARPWSEFLSSALATLSVPMTDWAGM